MNLAILTSGGDCAGMNPAIKRFVEYANETGHQAFAVYDGLGGLIAGDIRPIGPSDVSGIIFRGGTVIRSSRSTQFREPEARARAAAHLAERGIGHLVVLGGDGSFQAARALSDESAVQVACVPSTIDNDVPGSDYSLGVDSALNVIREAIDGIRDTASSFRRAFVVETMGRHCGYLALISALVSGAEALLIPEIEYDLESIERRLAREVKDGRTYAIAICSEAVEGGAAALVKIFQEKIGIDSRITVLGHLQRGGSPTVHDRRMAVEFITAAIDGLLGGDGSFAVASKGGKIIRKPLGTDEVATLDPGLLRLADRLCR
jgi:6-phosphofructokinase 1